MKLLILVLAIIFMSNCFSIDDSILKQIEEERNVLRESVPSYMSEEKLLEQLSNVGTSNVLRFMAIQELSQRRSSRALSTLINHVDIEIVLNAEEKSHIFGLTGVPLLVSAIGRIGKPTHVYAGAILEYGAQGAGALLKSLQESTQEVKEARCLWCAHVLKAYYGLAVMDVYSQYVDRHKFKDPKVFCMLTKAMLENHDENELKYKQDPLLIGNPSDVSVLNMIASVVLYMKNNNIDTDLKEAQGLVSKIWAFAAFDSKEQSTIVSNEWFNSNASKEFITRVKTGGKVLRK